MRGGGSCARVCDGIFLLFVMLTKYIDAGRTMAVMDLELVWEW